MRDELIAENYQQALAAMLDRARFYSGRKWTLDEGEHDPGRTTLELLANALAGLQSCYQSALAAPDLFSPDPPPERWSPVPEDKSRLRFQPNYNAPEAADFQPRPVSGPELVRDLAEHLELRRAWVRVGEGEAAEVLVEFPPLIVADGTEAAFSPPEFVPPAGPEEKAWKAARLALVNRHLGRLQGLGQPPLKARELNFSPLRLRLTLRLEAEPGREADGGEALTLQSLLADLMTAANEWLRPPAEPLQEMRSGDLLKVLRSVSGQVVSVGLEPSDRLSPPESETISLATGRDAFEVTEWRVALDWGSGTRLMTSAEILACAYLADRNLVAGLRRARRDRRPGPVASPTPLPVTPPPLLYRQYPACYQLESESGSRPWTGNVAQFQGWLLMFDQLLGDARRLLDQPGRYFQPRPVEVEHFQADVDHPYLETLAGGRTYRDGLDGLARRERGALAERLLRHLAALQGEEPWWPLDWFEGRADFQAWLAAWLRRLPYLNGRRLEYSRGRSGRLDEGGAVLEERLAWLLGPLVDHPARPPQELFDMRTEENQVTGRREYRCFIRAGAAPDAEGPIRLICDLLSPSPEEAERVALRALSQAACPDYYHLCGPHDRHGGHDRRGGRVRVGRLASLPEAVRSPADPWSADPGKSVKDCGGLPAWGEADGHPPPDRLIAETVAWARSLAPPWVRVLDYVELGENRPFEIAVLLTDAVPGDFRARVRKMVESQLPAHLLAGIYFVGPEMRARVDHLLHDPPETGYGPWSRRYEQLVELLRELESHHL